MAAAKEVFALDEHPKCHSANDGGKFECEKNKVEVWIASHLDSPQRQEYLTESLENLSWADSVRVSVSGLEPPKVSSENVVIDYSGPDSLPQFDHLALLYASRREEDVTVVFVDDDDVLLPSIVLTTD